METISFEDQQILDCMQKAVDDALERKRRLGHYAIIWQDGRPVIISGMDLKRDQEMVKLSDSKEFVQSVLQNHVGDCPEVSPKCLDETQILQLVQATCGAWGKKTLEETESWIKQRRLEDWGEEVM